MCVVDILCVVEQTPACRAVLSVMVGVWDQTPTTVVTASVLQAALDPPMTSVL